MTIQALRDIENQLESVVSDNQNEIKETKDSLELTKQKIVKANEDLEKAQNENDIEAYDKAKKDLWTANNIKDFQENKLKKGQDLVLMSADEVQVLVSEVNELTDDLRKEQFQNALKLLQDLKKIADESLELKELANKLLRTIRYDVQKQSENNIGYFHDEYKKDMVIGLYHQIENVPMFNQTIRENDSND